MDILLVEDSAKDNLVPQKRHSLRTVLHHVQSDQTIGIVEGLLYQPDTRHSDKT